MDFLTINGELQIKNGDIVTATKEQHDRELIKRIMRCNKGSFVLAPQIGVGLESDVNSHLPLDDLKQKIRINLEADKFKVKKDDIVIDPEGERIQVNAVRKE